MLRCEVAVQHRGKPAGDLPFGGRYEAEGGSSRTLWQKVRKASAKVRAFDFGTTGEDLMAMAGADDTGALAGAGV